MHVVLKRNFINTWIGYKLHQQKNKINENMQAHEQFFICKFEGRLDLNKYTILVQGRF